MELTGEALALFATAGWFLALLFYGYWRIADNWAQSCNAGWGRALDRWGELADRAHGRLLILGEVARLFPAAHDTIAALLDEREPVESGTKEGASDGR